jgi:hypothetical protein
VEETNDIITSLKTSPLTEEIKQPAHSVSSTFGLLSRGGWLVCDSIADLENFTPVSTGRLQSEWGGRIVSESAAGIHRITH